MAESHTEADAGWVQGLLLASAACMLVLSVSATLPIIPAMLRAFKGRPAIDMLVPFSVVAPMLTLALTGWRSWQLVVLGLEQARHDLGGPV